MQVGQIRSRGQPSWWLGWASLALEAVAIGFFVAWARIDSDDPAFYNSSGWWVIPYVVGGLMGAVAVIVGRRTTPHGRGWIPGLVALLFTLGAFCLAVVAMSSGFGGGE